MAVKKKEKTYEISVHYVPTLEESEAGEKLTSLKKTIESDGEVIGEEPVQKMNLAYTIRHKTRKGDGTYDRHDESYFGSVKFRSPQELIVTLQADLQGDDQVIRFLTLETVGDNTRIGPVLPGENKEDDSEDADKKKGKKKKDDENDS